MSLPSVLVRAKEGITALKRSENVQLFEDEQADEPDRLPTIGYSKRPRRNPMPAAFGGDGREP